MRGRPPRLGDRRRAGAVRHAAGAHGAAERARAGRRRPAARPPARRRAPDGGGPRLPPLRGARAAGDGRGPARPRRAASAASSGHVAVCASPIVSTYALPTILKRFSQTHPGVQVVGAHGPLRGDDRARQARRGRRRAAARVQRPRASSSSRSTRTSSCSSCTRMHPSGDVVRLAELAAGAVRPLRPRVELPRADERDVPRGGDRAASVMELDNVDSAKKMIELGLGIAFLPHVAVVDEVRSGRLRIVELADRDPAAPPDRRGAAQGRGRSARRDGRVPRAPAGDAARSFRPRRRRQLVDHRSRM